MNSEYVARMEVLLTLYALPYEARYPLVCVDERPFFLIGNVVEGPGIQTDQVAKEHYV